jgi:hypothetical protein
VDDIATQFNNTKSHSDMDADERNMIQKQWHEGDIQRKWMVATTGFIHGIDQSAVDAVIFLELPYGILNFVQGAGRAGRNGQPAHVFLVNYRTVFIEPRQLEHDPNGIIPGNRYAQNTTLCRRSIMSNVMDGHPVSCSDLYGAIRCDLCNPEDAIVIASKKLIEPPLPSSSPARQQSPYHDSTMFDDETIAALDDSFFGPAPTLPPPPPPSGVSLLGPSISLQLDHALYNQSIQTKKAKVAELTLMTQLIQGGFNEATAGGYCIICWAWKNKFIKKTPEHIFFIACKEKEDRYVNHGVGWIDNLKRKFGFRKYQYCWTCGLPQGEFIPATHPPFKKGSIMQCPFEDLVAVILWFIIHDEDMWMKACKAFPALKPHMPVEEIADWMKKEEPHLFYNGLEMVIWFWLTIKKPSI